MLSGLPGAGKDHWIEKNLSDWPVVSLDAIREESRRKDPDLPPRGSEGTALSRLGGGSEIFLFLVQHLGCLSVLLSIGHA